MTDFNNDISRSPYYISKSRIDRRTLDKWKVPKEIKVSEVKKAFSHCNKKLVKTGVSFDSRYQRHTEYVFIKDLLLKTRDMYWDKSKHSRKN